MAAHFLRLIRPHQWLKNGFVLVGTLFGHRWVDAGALEAVALAFCAFCAAASAVYVLNDLLDAESDRQHPSKRHRPVASGAVSTRQASVLALALAAGSLLLASLAATQVAGFVAAYMVLNVAYGLRLKHMVIVDVFTISAGFMLRLLAGTAGLGIAPSSWLLLCGLFLTLFLGFAKRRAELLGSQGTGATSTRKVLVAYRPEVLDQFLAVTSACTVLCYALYTVSAETIATHHTDKLVYTLPFIVYGMFRYLYLLHGNGMGQDTARDLLTDKHMLLTLLAWAGVSAGILA